MVASGGRRASGKLLHTLQHLLHPRLRASRRMRHRAVQCFEANLANNECCIHLMDVSRVEELFRNECVADEKNIVLQKVVCHAHKALVNVTNVTNTVFPEPIELKSAIKPDCSPLSLSEHRCCLGTSLSIRIRQ